MRLWDTQSGDELHGHGGFDGIAAVPFSDDRRVLVATSEDKAVWLWEDSVDDILADRVSELEPSGR